MFQPSQTTPKREKPFQFSMGCTARITECFSFHRPHQKEKSLPIQHWGKDACWSAPGQTKADLGRRLSKHVSCKDRVVSEVTFLHHHILPSPCLQWLVPFHLCVALRHLSFHSSLPALPSLTHSLTIKLTNIEHFSPALLSLFFPYLLYLLATTTSCHVQLLH